MELETFLGYVFWAGVGYFIIGPILMITVAAFTLWWFSE